MEYGKAEGRTASSASTVYNGVDYALVYDYEYYKKNYADLRAAFGDDPEKYLQHFIQCGMAEGRQASASFKVSAYKNRYADLRAAFGNNNVAYYLHYMKNGKAEGRTAN